jgi:hypothetical protein
MTWVIYTGAASEVISMNHLAMDQRLHGIGMPKTETGRSMLGMFMKAEGRMIPMIVDLLMTFRTWLFPLGSLLGRLYC